jgi:hypothetical protein
MKTRAKCLTVALTIAATVCAQEEQKFTVKPTGRILFDAAYVILNIKKTSSTAEWVSLICASA